MKIFPESWSSSTKSGKEIKKKTISSLSLLMISHGFIHLYFVGFAAVLPLIRLEFSLSYAQIGILMFTLSMLTSAGSIPMGFISDRMSRLRLISYMFLVIAIVAPFLLLARNVVFLFLLLGFLRLCMATFHPAAQAHLSHRYPYKRGKVFGLYEVGGSLGMVIAPSLALGIASIWGWKSVYAVYALPCLLLAFGITKISEGRAYLSDNSNSKSVARFLNGLRIILSSRRLRLILGAQGAYSGILTSVLSYFPIFLVDLHELDIFHAGYLLTLLLCGGVLGKFVGGRTSDRWGRNRVMGFSFTLLIPLFLLFSFIEGKLALAILSFFFGLVSNMILPVIMASIGDHVTEEAGLTYGIQSLVALGCGALCSLAAGVLADFFGIGVVFQLLTGVCFLGFACTFLLVLEERKNPVQ